jgi:predicted ATPase/DNA-binding SARP family transcriptional activator/DNA-binding CsgD family transcriptional regulator
MDLSGFEGVTRPQGQQERPEAVRVWLLGGFRVSVGRRTLTGDAWRLKKAAALVKLLALEPDHRLHREQVMDLLWLDLGKRAATNNLRQVLYGARRILDPASNSHNRYLSLQDEQLALCPGGVLRVDVDAFDEAVAIARRSRDPATYRAAIELYAGDLLPEDRYEQWVEGRRENLKQTYFALLIELADLYEERGQYEPAIVALQKAVAEDPTFEEAHAALMRLYALSGRPREALVQYERLQEALSRRLGTEPGETTQRLREDIAAGNVSSDRPQVGLPEEPPAIAKHNLPAARTSFVGREQEIVEVKRELAMTRILTLSGAGGSGKTRLALEVAMELVGTYPDGVSLVELAGLSDGTLVPQELAATLEVQEQADQPLTDTLIEFVREKKILLVLDNCEHLIDAAADLSDTLLDSCPHLTILATSREPLGVAGEIDRPVPALSVPDVADRLTVEELERYESARLFAERALFVERTLYGSSGFALQPDNTQTVAQICSRLEGIPLAIELAAAWVGTLSVEQISERLKDSLRLLKSGSRTITSRQRTLRGAMDWSYNLLSEPERILFRRLSVFAGGWTLEAAEAVSAGDGIEKEAVLELLWPLVNKSLVVAESGTQRAAARYRMLEPIRQYAREKLGASGEADEVQDRHVAFFLALAEEAEPELAGPQQRLWVERLEAEHDNMRKALSWVLEREQAELGLRFGAALWRFWFAQGYLSEGIRSMEEVLAGSESAVASLRVKTLEGMGWLTQVQGDTEQAKAVYEEMLTLSRESDDRENIAIALNSLGALALAQGDNERARVLLEENMAVLRELEAERKVATKLQRYQVLGLLGFLAINEEGDYTRGAALWEESLALAHEVGDAYRAGSALSNLGYITLLRRDYERATALSEEALEFAHDLGSAGVEIAPEAWVNLGLAALGLSNHERANASFKEGLVMSQHAGRNPSVINTLEGMASLAGALENDSRAAHLWGSAAAAREVTGIALPPGERALHEPYLAPARSRLGEELWEEALDEGRAMSLEEAAEYALAKQAEPIAPVSPASEDSSAEQLPISLTPREKEVALLVAQELSNRQIASTLTLSEHTVATHVRNVLKKLGLYSRNQIAAWFAEHQPLP